MVFSSPVFLFYFLPVVFLLYFLSRILFKDYTVSNFILIFFSLFFYLYGSGVYLVVLLSVIVIVYLSGLSASRKNKVGLWFGIISTLLMLAIFKYSNFITKEIHNISPSNFDHFLRPTNFLLPLGISFFTFQGMSYIIDVYRSKDDKPKSLFDATLYISMFPQLVAGPIVRYQDIRSQLNNHPTSIDNVATGAMRFIWGLGKKVLIADNCANIANVVYKLPGDDLTSLVAVLGILSYTFQIYFDFSGYSDMAIGLGRIFGFQFPENFNRPYSATSMRDFWKRWHITLTTWFRDYLYIPLGGNQKGVWKTYLNLWIVFLCTGIWHGANWTFLLWGIFHGACLTVERLLKIKTTGQINFIRRLFVFVLVSLGWVLFRSETIEQAVDVYKSLIFQHGIELPYQVSLALTHKNMIFLGVALFSVLLPRDFVVGKILQNERSLVARFVEVPIFLGLCFAILLQISSSRFSPFIYFQF